MNGKGNGGGAGQTTDVAVYPDYFGTVDAVGQGCDELVDEEAEIDEHRKYAV